MLKELAPLTDEEWDFVIEQLRKEEENPSPERLNRIEEAIRNARKMKKNY